MDRQLLNVIGRLELCLEQLEARVSELMQRNDALKQENDMLKEPPGPRAVESIGDSEKGA